MTGHLTVEPTVVERDAQPYVAIRRRVTMQTMDEIVDRITDVVDWVERRGLEPAGPAFLRYLVIDMDHELEVEAGVPLVQPSDGDGEVVAGELPAGRYVVAAQPGHPDALVGVTGDLLAWAERHGYAWDVERTPSGERWGCRVEFYPTDPAVEPDMDRWTTELVFRLAD